MNTNKLILQKAFKASEIEVRIVNPKVIPQSLLTKIDEFWNLTVEDAKARGKKVWDSEVYCFDSFRIEDKHLIISLYIERYKNYIYFYKNNDKYSFEDKDVIIGSCVVAFIKTSDNKYVFATATTAFALDEITMIGGVCSKTELEIKNGDDLFTCQVKELEEELNITPEHISNMTLEGLVLGSTNTLIYVFSLNLDLSEDEVRQKHFESNDGELKSLTFFTKEEAIKNFSLFETSSPKYKLTDLMN